MNITGWCALKMIPASSAKWTRTTGTGMSLSWSPVVGRASARCLRSNIAAIVALHRTAIAAFHPKVDSMKNVSQDQVLATIRIGGAAYALRVPPIEILTNSVPSAKYLGISGISERNATGANIRAAIVIAAGSVIRDPRRGTAA